MDLLQVMNPIDVNVQIGNIKQTRDGGVILGCSHPDGISKLKEIADKELSSK